MFQLFMIGREYSNGCDLAMAESAVSVVCYINVKRTLKGVEIFEGYYRYWIAALPILIIGGVLKLADINYILRMFFTIGISIAAYFGILYFLKNPYFLEILGIIKERGMKLLGNCK